MIETVLHDVRHSHPSDPADPAVDERRRHRPPEDATYYPTLVRELSQLGAISRRRPFRQENL